MCELARAIVALETSSLDPVESPEQAQPPGLYEIPSNPAAPPPADLSDAEQAGVLSPGGRLPTPFRHSGWHADRQRVYDALCRLNGTTGWKKTERFAECGSSHWLFQSRTEPGTYRVAPGCCHSRWCLPCAQARANAIAQNVLAAVRGKTIRLLTLTIKPVNNDLTACVDKLIRSYKLLRRTDQWKAHVTAAMAFVEVTHNEQAQTWHVHMHALTEGKFWAQSDVQNTWVTITGDSRVVDIRLVRNPVVAARYVCKYVTKPIGATALRQPILLDAAIAALHGRKLVIATGGWKTMKLTAPPHPTNWKPINRITPAWVGEHTDSAEPYRQALGIATRAALDGTGPKEFTLRLDEADHVHWCAVPIEHQVEQPNNDVPTDWPLLLP